MWKKYLVGVIVLVTVLSGGFYLAWNNQAKELRAAIASHASTNLGVSVSIEGSEIVGEGIDKILKLSGLSVANPSGFSGRHAIRIGEVWIRYDDRASNATDIVVREVVANGVEIAFERRGGQSNLEILQQNSIAEKNRPVIVRLIVPPKIIVDSFSTRGGKLKIRHELLGADNPLEVGFTPLGMGSIGRREGGIMPVDLTLRLISVFAGDANRLAVEHLQRAVADRR